MKFLQCSLVVVFLGLALFLRFYQLGANPPSLSWDEVAIGYDAWSVANFGQDQWGQSWPIIFKSFGEYKYPFHIYATALVVKLIGLSDFSVRLPSAIMGLVSLGLIFYLSQLLTKNRLIATCSTLLLAVSPWSIQFSRLNWETNFALCFFLLGLIFFIKAFSKNHLWLVLAGLFWGIDLFTYNAAKVFVPLFVSCLLLIYRRFFWKQKLLTVLSIGIFGLFILANFLNPELSGSTRFSQVALPISAIESTSLFKLTHKHLFGQVELVLQNYLSYFSPQFLIISGDANLQHSTGAVGEIYWLELPFLVIGFLVLLKGHSKPFWQILLVWLLLAPIAGSITKEAPHAGRAMFELGVIQIVEAIGFKYLYDSFKSQKLKLIYLSLASLILIINISYFGYNYFVNYPMKSSEDWQYSYKIFYQKYGPTLSSYDQVYFTPEYAQPYIFALYYLKFDPYLFRATALYNQPSEWGFSTVTKFANFNFNRLDNIPAGHNLLVLAKPLNLSNYHLVDQLNFLNGKGAFYIYSQ